MVTNTSGNEDDTSADDDGKEVTEDDLRELKYGADGVETPAEGEDETDDSEEDAEESEEAGDDDQDKPEGDAEEGEEDDSEEEPPAPTFVKQFPHIKGDTPEEYAKNLEAAYNNSTTEALRLKSELDGKTDDKADDAEPEITNPLELYAKQQLDNEIKTAYDAFAKKYPQAVPGTQEYAQFTVTVDTLSKTIIQSEKRLASPAELYDKAAVILGWQPADVTTKDDKVRQAAKDGAGTPKTSSATKSTPKTKVTPEMIALNRKMFPGKSDAEIIKELEPHIQ